MSVCSGSVIASGSFDSRGWSFAEILELSNVLQSNLEITADRAVAKLETKTARALELFERGTRHGQLETIAPPGHAGEKFDTHRAGVIRHHRNGRLLIVKDHCRDCGSQIIVHVALCGGASRALLAVKQQRSKIVGRLAVSSHKKGAVVLIGDAPLNVTLGSIRIGTKRNRYRNSKASNTYRHATTVRHSVLLASVTVSSKVRSSQALPPRHPETTCSAQPT